MSLGSSFAVLPLSGVVGALVTPIESARVWYGIDTAMITCVYAAGCWALWPANSRDAFKVGYSLVNLLEKGIFSVCFVLASGSPSTPGIHAANNSHYYGALCNTSPHS